MRPIIDATPALDAVLVRRRSSRSAGTCVDEPVFAAPAALRQREYAQPSFGAQHSVTSTSTSRTAAAASTEVRARFGDRWLIRD